MTPHQYRLVNARVLLPDGIVAGDVTVTDGRIAAICSDAAPGHADRDVGGALVAPAMIDVHGDAFERQVMPRPGVHFGLPEALLDTDRQLAANGIATAYHALTLSWAPGLRSVAQGTAFVDALGALAPRLTVENRLQLRWEIFAPDAVPLIERVLAATRSGGLIPAVAFNDHTSMVMRPFDQRVQDRRFELDPAFVPVDPSDPRMEPRVAGAARRAGLEPAAYLALQEQVYTRRGAVRAQVEKVGRAARAAGAPMLSHDDTCLETRDFYRAIGARVSEFPMVRSVAEAARAASDGIVFGAPNALRGGSHIGSPGAADMVEAGLSDALASDYYYPALLAAVGRLHAEGRAPLHRLWDQVSAGPARIMGLTDRGRIEVGLRADLVVVDWPEAQVPVVRATYVAGRAAYLSAPMQA